MEPNLRPLTMGEILDRTAQLYRTNFLLFAGISAVLAGLVLVINLISIGLVEALHLGQFAAIENFWIQLLGWGSFLLMFVVGQVATAANNRAVAWLCLGEPASIANAYRSILARFGRYLWIGAAKLLIAWTPVILLYGAFQASYLYFMRTGVLPRPGEVPQPHAGDTSGTLMFAMVSLGFFVLIWPALTYSVFMALRYALALPASVVENLSARKALRRSIELTKGARGRIFMLWILVGVIAFMAGAITQTFFVAYSMKHHYVIPLGIRILQQVIMFCTNTLVGPVLATGTCLFYFDQRVRKEGFDIEWMMQAAGMVPAEPPLESAPPELAGAAADVDAPTNAVAVPDTALDDRAGGIVHD